MLDINEIHEEIKKLEECDNITWSICEKLASLYIIREHFPKQEKDTKEMSGMIMSPMMK